MQLRDNWRRVARETRAQPFARISRCQLKSMPRSGKSADFTVWSSPLPITTRADEMKEREAVDPKTLKALESEAKWAMEPAVTSTA